MKFLLALITLGLSISMTAQKVKIKPSDLPDAALTFVETNFKNTAIHHAVKETKGDKTTFEVTMANDIEVEFSENGNWKEVKGHNKAIPTAFIPATITAYIKTNYPAAAITKIDKDSKGFDVELSDNTDLDFDQNGKFLKVDK